MDYDLLDAKIDNQFKLLALRLSGFISKATIGFAVVGLACAVALIGFGLALHRESGNSKEIQAQRKSSIVRACEEQNDRHDNTLRQFNVVAKQYIKKYPKRAAEVRASIKTNVGIIEALAPKQDCAAVAAKAVKEDG